MSVSEDFDVSPSPAATANVRGVAVEEPTAFPDSFREAVILLQQWSPKAKTVAERERLASLRLHVHTIQQETLSGGVDANDIAVAPGLMSERVRAARLAERARSDRDIKQLLSEKKGK